MRKTVFITGVSGFIGGHLAKKLSEDKDFKVLGLSRSLGGYATLQGDLDSLSARDLNSVDTVVHLAAVYPEEEQKYPGRSYQVNVEGTKRLLTAAKGAGVGRVIYISTGGVFERGKNIKINSPKFSRLAENEYFRTKELANSLVLNEKEMEVCVVYLFLSYGPGQKEPRLIPRLINRIKNSETVTTTKDGGPELSCIYIDDLVEQIKRLCLIPKTEREVIVSGNSIKMAEIINLIGDFVGKKPIIDKVEGLEDMVAEDTAHKLTGYIPKIDIKQGLKRTILSN